jgi:hypothetical protein
MGTDSVTGFIDLATALGDNSPLQSITPSSFSFSDGVQTLNNTTPGITSNFLDIATNSQGDITAVRLTARRVLETLDLAGTCGRK